MRGTLLVSSFVLLAPTLAVSASSQVRQAHHWTARELGLADRALPLPVVVVDASAQVAREHNDTAAAAAPPATHLLAARSAWVDRAQLSARRLVADRHSKAAPAALLKKRARCQATKAQRQKKKQESAIKKPVVAAVVQPEAIRAASVKPEEPQNPKHNAHTTTTARKVAPTQDVKAVVQTKPNSSSSPSTVEKSGDGLIGFVSSNCGPSKATASAPNGAESWLNCGLTSSGGWTPPAGVEIHMLKTVTVAQALASNSVWEPCRQYEKLFEKYGALTDLPPILLMSVALQESTCKATTAGDNGGAHGLMQITTDKCSGQGSAACADPDYNVRTGAQYIRTVLDAANGNIFKAMAAYNGWYDGMTESAARQAATSGCCVCQQNLDYLFQLFNGWILGKTGYELGSIGNLDIVREAERRYKSATSSTLLSQCGH